MKPSFQMSADARMLLQHMAKATVGQLFSYEELSRIIARPVGGGTAALQTAMRRCLRDHDMVFGNVRGTGIQRLDDKAIVDEGTTSAERMRKSARRSFERLSKADFSSLPREYQARFSAHTSVMATIAHMTGAKQIARIEKEIPTGRPELPVAETLRLFAK